MTRSVHLSVRPSVQDNLHCVFSSFGHMVRHIFSRVLRDSTPRFVGPSVCPSITGRWCKILNDVKSAKRVISDWCSPCPPTTQPRPPIFCPCPPANDCLWAVYQALFFLHLTRSENKDDPISRKWLGRSRKPRKVTDRLTIQWMDWRAICEFKNSWNTEYSFTHINSEFAHFDYFRLF